MKSRFAVSVVFILVAATFAPEVAADFAKLKSWTARTVHSAGAQVCTREASNASAPVRAREAAVQTILPAETSSGLVPGNSRLTGQLATAARQVFEVLYVMRSK